MKVVIARLNHETNTFSPVPTPLLAFGAGDPRGPAFGADAYAQGKGSQTAMGAFIELAEQRGCEIATPLFAMANPSGPVDAAAYRTMCASIVDAVAAGCDAILLDLHGAMVAEGVDDGEGELLARIREVAPKTPLAVALDLHGNISDRTIALAAVVVGFKTYPHVDMVETGVHAGRLLFAMMDTGRKPAMAIARPRVLAQTLRQNTEIPGAMRDAVEAARACEREGALAASVFGGFFLADIPDAGMSIVVVADDPAKARAWADRISGQARARRDEFIFHQKLLPESVAEAARIREGLVLLLDHGDNCMSGGTCDTMDVLAECLRQGLTNIGVGPTCDPAVVAQLVAAGIGATVTIDLGNKLPMPLIGLAARTPLRLTGRVKAVSPGEYTITGPIYRGTRCYMGRTVLFDTGAAEIVVTEQTQEPWDLGVFACVGLDPAAKRYLILKSRMYYRPVFGPMAAAVVECASAGCCASDLSRYAFTRVRRPVYPLDA